MRETEAGLQIQTYSVVSTCLSAALGHSAGASRSAQRGETIFIVHMAAILNTWDANTRAGFTTVHRWVNGPEWCGTAQSFRGQHIQPYSWDVTFKKCCWKYQHMCFMAGVIFTRPSDASHVWNELQWRGSSLFVATAVAFFFFFFNSGALLNATVTV